MSASNILEDHLAKGVGKTGKQIKYFYDPVRDRYIDPSKTTPLGNPEDFVADRPTHKIQDETKIQQQARKDPKIDVAEEEKMLAQVQQHAGQINLPDKVKPTGMPTQMMQEAKDRQKESSEEEEQQTQQMSEGEPKDQPSPGQTSKEPTMGELKEMLNNLLQRKNNRKKKSFTSKSNEILERHLR